MLMIIIVLLIVITLISIFWVKGIDHMLENHPGYNGEDFLDDDPS